jgi:hypothetical protein
MPLAIGRKKDASVYFVQRVIMQLRCKVKVGRGGADDPPAIDISGISDRQLRKCTLAPKTFQGAPRAGYGTEYLPPTEQLNQHQGWLA